MKEIYPSLSLSVHYVDITHNFMVQYFRFNFFETFSDYLFTLIIPFMNDPHL